MKCLSYLGKTENDEIESKMDKRAESKVSEESVLESVLWTNLTICRLKMKKMNDALSAAKRAVGANEFYVKGNHEDGG